MFTRIFSNAVAACRRFDYISGVKRRRRKIETVLFGNARVKIYRRTRKVAGNKYSTFEVCDYTSGRRKLRRVRARLGVPAPTPASLRLGTLLTWENSPGAGAAAELINRFLSEILPSGDVDGLEPTLFAPALGSAWRHAHLLQPSGKADDCRARDRMRFAV